MKVVVSTLLASAALFSTGCVNGHFISNKYYVPQSCLASCERLKVATTKYVLGVNIAKQQVSLFEDGSLVKILVASTSRFGIGEIEGSNCTPLGLHCIAEKVGEGEPAGTVFKERQIVGHTSDPQFVHAGITTRVMWLQGLDPGFNEGGNVDTHQRTIYIHGTSDQASLGKPASHGCIHLADDDLIPLFDLVPSGTLVWIARR